MKLTWIRYLLVLFILMLIPVYAGAQIKYIDLTKPYLRKIPMAIPVFRAATPNNEEFKLTTKIANELADALEFSGYFKMLERKGFLHDPQASGITNKEVNYSDWTVIGAELLITGDVRVQNSALELELRLFDTFKSKLLTGRRYRGPVRDQTAMVRLFCEKVIKELTGHAGFYHSRLAFVYNKNGHKEIYTCDYDGSNLKQVTNKKNICLFPAWSSDGKHIAFTSYAKGTPQIFIRHLASGKEMIVTRKGVQIAPAWVPGRFEFAATLTTKSDQEIYLLTGDGKMIKRLTNSRGIDVAPTWSPDGKKIAFVSKRSGTPQIYIKEVAAGRVTRLTYQGRYNTQPKWSPKGDRIAYSAMEGGEINIYITDIEGKHITRLTHNQGDNEAPTWSPDGSLIAFSSTRNGRSQIFVMTAFGTDQRRLLTLPGKQSDPGWSFNAVP